LTLSSNVPKPVVALGTTRLQPGLIHEFAVSCKGVSTDMRVGIAMGQHGWRFSLASNGFAVRESQGTKVCSVCRVLVRSLTVVG
jgi:hypothetical protein